MLDGEILQAAAAQLSYDYSCRPDDFFSTQNTATCSILNHGRREMKDTPDFFRMATMGKATVATADKHILPFVTELLKKYDGAQLFTGKVRYLLNSKLAPYNKVIDDVNIYYLPRTPYKYYRRDGFNIRVYEEQDIADVLYRYKGFSNALMYGSNKKRRDVLAVCALNGSDIIAMAGASSDSERFWQIGIDVLPEYRGRGIAAEIVSALTYEVFMHGAVPYYGTWSGNIASQNVAAKCGYSPAWTEMFCADIE